jgi:hypothetical protein
MTDQSSFKTDSEYARSKTSQKADSFLRDSKGDGPDQQSQDGSKRMIPVDRSQKSSVSNGSKNLNWQSNQTDLNTFAEPKRSFLEDGISISLTPGSQKEIVNTSAAFKLPQLTLTINLDSPVPHD